VHSYNQTKRQQERSDGGGLHILSNCVLQVLHRFSSFGCILTGLMPSLLEYCFVASKDTDSMRKRECGIHYIDNDGCSLLANTQRERERERAQETDMIKNRGCGSFTV
jgi:hypothetical protein